MKFTAEQLNAARRILCFVAEIAMSSIHQLGRLLSVRPVEKSGYRCDRSRMTCPLRRPSCAYHWAQRVFFTANLFKSGSPSFHQAGPRSPSALLALSTARCASASALRSQADLASLTARLCPSVREREPPCAGDRVPGCSSARACRRRRNTGHPVSRDAVARPSNERFAAGDGHRCAGSVARQRIGEHHISRR